MHRPDDPALIGYYFREVFEFQGGVMTEQDSIGADERVARLIQAARELIDAYEHKATATSTS